MCVGLVGFLALAEAPGAQTPDGKQVYERHCYEGNNVWTPGTYMVKKGEKARFKLYNRVKADPNVHGFAIDEFNVKVDVYRDKPETVEFVADKAGLFRIWCHLHPAHLPGQLLVLEK